MFLKQNTFFCIGSERHLPNTRTCSKPGKNWKRKRKLVRYTYLILAVPHLTCLTIFNLPILNTMQIFWQFVEFDTILANVICSFKIRYFNINDSKIAHCNVSINIVINHIFLWNHNYHRYWVMISYFIMKWIIHCWWHVPKNIEYEHNERHVEPLEHCWFLNGIIVKTITKLKIDATHILHNKMLNHVVYISIA